MTFFRFPKTIDLVEGYNHVMVVVFVVVAVNIRSLVELKVDYEDSEDEDILLERTEQGVLVLKPFIIKNLNEKTKNDFFFILQFLLDQYFV